MMRRASDSFHGDINYTQRDSATTNTAWRCGHSGRRRLHIPRDLRRFRLQPARRVAHMSQSYYTPALRYRFVPISFVYLLSIKFGAMQRSETWHRDYTTLYGMTGPIDERSTAPWDPQHAQRTEKQGGAGRSMNIRNVKTIYNLQIHSKQHFWDRCLQLR